MNDSPLPPAGELGSDKLCFHIFILGFSCNFLCAPLCSLWLKKSSIELLKYKSATRQMMNRVIKVKTRNKKHFTINPTVLNKVY